MRCFQIMIFLFLLIFFFSFLFSPPCDLYTLQQPTQGKSNPGTATVSPSGFLSSPPHQPYAHQSVSLPPNNRNSDYQTCCCQNPGAGSALADVSGKLQVMPAGMPWAGAGCPQDSRGLGAASARGAQGQAGVMKGLGIMLGYFCPYSDFLLF